jgi:uncharacterized MnhB-related membrane protein
MGKSGVFQDSKGNWSSARIGAFAIIVIALFLVCWVVIVDKEYIQAAALFGSMTGVAITLYILGKHQDVKVELGAGGLKSLNTG